jgi:predicted peptidase
MIYSLFSPDARSPGKRYPLIIYLHGVGELGTADSTQGTAGKAA